MRFLPLGDGDTTSFRKGTAGDSNPNKGYNVHRVGHKTEDETPRLGQTLIGAKVNSDNSNLRCMLVPLPVHRKNLKVRLCKSSREACRTCTKLKSNTSADIRIFPVDRLRKNISDKRAETGGVLGHGFGCKLPLAPNLPNPPLPRTVPGMTVRRRFAGASGRYRRQGRESTTKPSPLVSDFLWEIFVHTSLKIYVEEGRPRTRRRTRRNHCTYRGHLDGSIFRLARRGRRRA